jgi:single-strand DNA-binding protein
MPSYNSLTICGNVGTNVEMRFTPSGIPVSTFNMAVNKYKIIIGEKKESAQWFRIVCFNKLAEFVNERIVKGESVVCVGEVTLRCWNNDSGKKMYSLEVLANKVLGFRKSVKSTVVKPDDIPEEGDIEPDEIPF